MMNANELKKQIERYDVISFDIFDTLVSRIVGESHNVFKFMEEILKDKYGKTFEGFCDNRIQAELDANKKKVSEEVSLSDIYQCMNIVNKKTVLELETKLEIDFAERNQEIYDIYELCVKLNKRIMICSDMYLDRQTIETILAKCGYYGYEKLFISSEYGKRKLTGALYTVLLDYAKVQKKSILHIGDNKKSDFIMARLAGIESLCYIPTNRNKMRFDYARTLLYGNMPKHFSNEYYWQDVGKYTLGNFMYGYTRWLVRELEKENFEHIFFLSRDGWIMKQACEKIVPERLKSKFSYLYASRKSLIVPSLHLYDGYRARCSIMFWNNHFDIKEFVTAFGLEFNKYKIVLDEIVGDYSTVYSRSELLTNERLIETYSILEKDIELNSKEQYVYLIEYLKQECFEGKVAIVDSGWFGNLQHAIEKCLNSSNLNADVYGFYIGIRKDSSYIDLQKMEGFLFLGNENLTGQNLETKVNAIVEAFCSKCEGTTIGYERKNGLIVPITMTNNCDDKEKILTALQESALDRVEFLHEIEYVLGNKVSNWMFFEGFCRIGVEPDIMDSWRIGKFVENVSLRGTKYYILHLGKVESDIHRLGWKIGQLKRVLRINIDYMKLYTYMEKR